ncbi:MAG TPA: hypothetical protein VNC59_04550, partial [Thermoanaerobaculia bacterium]|nr:hypothetical protein [Thermoanaerobaculia bacterium]
DHADDIIVRDACDTVTGAGGPSTSCDILVSATTGTCSVGDNLNGTTITCRLDPGESVTFRSNFYTVQPSDPATLNNQAQVFFSDTCDGSTTGCDTTTSSTQITASTTVVSGCSEGAPLNCPSDGNVCNGPESCDATLGCVSGPNAADSTACGDTDGNACTTAGCDGAGTCDQGHITTVCTDDSNVCNGVPACNPANGVCEAANAADSTTCGDTDGNACTTAGCDGAGTCDQNHNTVSCNDDGNVCNGPETCNPANGQCASGPAAADSTVCTDSDGIACTTAGCDGLGACDQQHIDTCTTGCGFLLIDEDSIDNGLPPNYFDNISNCGASGCDVNDHIARIGLREELQWFDENPGAIINLWTGSVGDEGWFALEQIPSKWNSGGQQNGLANFLAAGPGLGSGRNPEKHLDKIPHVNPLRATGLEMLENSNACICAVVYDSDISINYDNPINGSLKGANLGIVAFEVLDVSRLTGQSSGSLPVVQIQVLDADTVCSAPLTLFDAPTLRSSSEPYDVNPDP